MAYKLDVHLETVKKSMGSIGFTPEEAEVQMNEVGKIATMAILHRLINERYKGAPVTPQSLEKFIQENFTQEYLTKVIEEESGRMIDDYLKAVTINLPQTQKDTFFNSLAETS